MSMKTFRDKYVVVVQTQVDYLGCLRPLEDAVLNEPLAKERIDLIRQQLGPAFRQMGWKGEGNIRCFFIPAGFYWPELEAYSFDYSPVEPDPGCWPDCFDDPADTIEPDPQYSSGADRASWSGEIPRDSIPF